ncbi:AraC family transcriptional regulator [Paraburkholderia sp. A2WS-5]|uniref:helix-turn-helix domain-containing protein n=1 Tax=unclassified Paraburkholderia TaxID=2615204 RepID=UPI003B793CCC
MTVQFVGLARAARPISPAIGDVLRTIDASFAQPLNLDTLASVAGLSVSRFTARFRGETGLSPHRYLCLVRVRRAQDLLRAGLAPSVVATDVGFFDQSHLCRHFRRVLGITPRDYVAAREGRATASLSQTCTSQTRTSPTRMSPTRMSPTRTCAEGREATCQAA